MKDRFYYALEKGRLYASKMSESSLKNNRRISFCSEDDITKKEIEKVYREYCYDIVKDELIK